MQRAGSGERGVWVGSVFAIAVAGGCASPAGYALQGAARDARASRALLQGPIAFVDGEDVSEHGDLFVLPVGCHVVTTVSKWADADDQAGVWVQLKPLTYAISMVPNHRYFVRFSGGSRNGLTADFSVDAGELDQNAKQVRKLEPSPSEEVAICRSEHASALSRAALP
ncbi:MAG TPA: hypothetical protein VG937_11290 [Polyangiaceae bacterium]|nr:hypothetical protein [Polyangiaceae bacterium]